MPPPSHHVDRGPGTCLDQRPVGLLTKPARPCLARIDHTHTSAHKTDDRPACPPGHAGGFMLFQGGTQGNAKPRDSWQEGQRGQPCHHLHGDTRLCHRPYKAQASRHAPAVLRFSLLGPGRRVPGGAGLGEARGRPSPVFAKRLGIPVDAWHGAQVWFQTVSSRTPSAWPLGASPRRGAGHNPFLHQLVPFFFPIWQHAPISRPSSLGEQACRHFHHAGGGGRWAHAPPSIDSSEEKNLHGNWSRLAQLEVS